MRLSDVVASRLAARLPATSTVAVTRREATTVVGVEAAELVVADGATALDRLDQLTRGFWVGWCSFELGHALERVHTRHASLEPRVVPDLVFARFDTVAVVDAAGRVTIEGEGAGRRLLDEAVAAGELPCAAPTALTVDTVGAVVDDQIEWRSSLTRAEYAERVDTVLDLLRAGECYQVNLTRRLTLPRPLDPTELYRALGALRPAPHLAMLRVAIDGYPLAVVSASPERFLQWRGRSVETRPIKGTAPDAGTLRASAKDRAENVMIVDLARNDLGRVCVPGSISVPSLCAVEPHPGLHHLVSTVKGTLRAGIGTGALVAATFPPASVTGAPKPRVLQVIEDLESVRRGVYCGAFGWIDTNSDEGDLAVAIRTFTIGGPGPETTGWTHLGVGGGVVADSQPSAEWDETALKAAQLLAAADRVARTGELVDQAAGALVRT